MWLLKLGDKLLKRAVCSESSLQQCYCVHSSQHSSFQCLPGDRLATLKQWFPTKETWTTATTAGVTSRPLVLTDAPLDLKSLSIQITTLPNNFLHL